MNDRLKMLVKGQGDATALVHLEALSTDGTSPTLSYDQLFIQIDLESKKIETRPKSLVLIMSTNDLNSVMALLTMFSKNCAVILTHGSANLESIFKLIDGFKPEFITGPTECPGGYEKTGAILQTPIYKRIEIVTYSIHPDLALLLPTSGSTGIPKLVRLSWQAIISNASSISRYLHLNAQSRAITSLPLSYAYGLSVLMSHLFSGASIGITARNPLEQKFWDQFSAFGSDCFAGVPSSYQMLDQIRIWNSLPASLKYMTQAGGRLAPELALKVNRVLSDRQIKFYMMYGQTEATARMTYLPPDDVEAKPDSVGVPIPNGEISIEDGEVVYRGLNVMMGYATRLEHLAEEDQLNGTLKTGDLGYLDEDGYLVVTGRKNRFSKAMGLRIDLDLVEKLFSDHSLAVAATSDDSQIFIHCENSQEAKCQQQLLGVANRLGLSIRVLKIHCWPQMPLLASGKIDYPRLANFEK